MIASHPLSVEDLVRALHRTTARLAGPSLWAFREFQDELLTLIADSNSAQATLTDPGSPDGTSIDTPAPVAPTGCSPSIEAASSTTPGSVAGVFERYPLPWKCDNGEMLAANGSTIIDRELRVRDVELRSFVVAAVNAVGGRPERVTELLAANGKLVEEARGHKIAYENALHKIDALTAALGVQHATIGAFRREISTLRNVLSASTPEEPPPPPPQTSEAA